MWPIKEEQLRVTWRAFSEQNAREWPAGFFEKFTYSPLSQGSRLRRAFCQVPLTTRLDDISARQDLNSHDMCFSSRHEFKVAWRSSPDTKSP